jgi:PKD repeat protein
MHTRLPLLIAFLLTTLVGSVASCDSTVTNEPGPSPALRLSFPVHETSGLTEYVLAGKDTDSRSPGALEAGNALQLDGSGGGFEYAVYRFNPGLNRPDSVSVLLEEPATSGAWVGIANFDASRWDFSGPFTAQKTLVADEAAYTSPAGNIWVAVITADTSATVNALSVRTINPNNALPAADVVADVSGGNIPLTAQFDAGASLDTDGQIIEYAWDFDGDGLYEGFSDGPQVTHVYTAPGQFTAKLRVTDEQFGRATDTVTIDVNVAGNAAPLANFNRSPGSGTAPFETVFTCGGSDPDGTIVRYEWDWEGDGTYDVSTANPEINHLFVTAGNYPIVLRVTDNAGAQGTATNPVLVHGWDRQILPGSPLGFTTSLKLVNGSPAIAFQANGPILEFVRATDAFGGQWGDPPVLVDASLNAGQYISMEIVNGFPAMAYFNSGTSDLLYVRASDADGSSWSPPLTIDSTGVVGANCCLAIVNGNPAISYFDGTNNKLRYVRAANADGTAWSPIVNADNSGGVESGNTTLLIVNGQPAIAYRANGDVDYVRATDINGGVWGAPVGVNTDAPTNFSLGMVIASTRPAICYETGGAMKFVRASNTDGTAWDAPLTLSTNVNFGTVYAAMTLMGTKPVICFCDEDTNLNYLEAQLSTGTVWDAPVLLDSVDHVGDRNCIFSIAGKPVISYRGNGGMGYMKLY